MLMLMRLSLSLDPATIQLIRLHRLRSELRCEKLWFGRNGLKISLSHAMPQKLRQQYKSEGELQA